MLYLTVRGLVVGLARVWLRIRIDGRENIPRTGPFILAPTHRSNIDFVLAGAVTRRRLRFMTKDSVWRSPVLGTLVGRLGGFPVSRGAPDREAIANSLVALASGDGLVLFPEGQRRSGPKVERLHDGVAYLASRARVPIIPVAIAGSEAAHPPGRRFIRPGASIRVHVGPPIPPPANTTTRVPRSTVRRVTEQLQVELQQLHTATATSSRLSRK